MDELTLRSFSGSIERNTYMGDLRFILSGNGSICGIHSWTEGFVPLKMPKRLWPDSDALCAQGKKAKSRRRCKKNRHPSKRRD